MMKKTKKSWVILALIAMILSMIPAQVFAAANTTAAVAPQSATMPDRIWGYDRYETAAHIAVQAYPDGTDTAILTSGDDDHLVDALTASPLAAKLKAPILLTENNRLSDATGNALKTLGVKNIYVVSGAIAPMLEALSGYKVTKVYGDNRFQTAIAIANQVTAAPTDIFVARADIYADALSAASIAASKGMPVLLTPTNSMDSSIKAYLDQHPTIKNSYVLGSTVAISDAMKAMFPNAHRLGGSNRWETNIAVLKAFDSDLKYDYVFVANGTDEHLVDALAGSALAALTKSPIVLSYSTIDPGSVSYVTGKMPFGAKAVALGASKVTPADVVGMLISQTPAGLAAAKVSVSITNPLQSQTDTVLVGQHAAIQAVVTDANGNVVPNANVLFTEVEKRGCGKDDTKFATDDAVVTTDAQGIAQMVMVQENNRREPIKATDVREIAAVRYSATVVGTKISAANVVNFAAVGYQPVSVANPENLEPPINNPNLTTPYGTWDMNLDPTEYVAGQQVSANGSANHAVEFTAPPKLILPPELDTHNVDMFKQDLNITSGAYNQYAGWSTSINLPEGLMYATLTFKSLQLDRYAVVTISILDEHGNVVPVATLQGPREESNFGVQIPIYDKHRARVIVNLASPGQIQTNKHGGLTLSDITGVYYDSVEHSKRIIDFPGASITWTTAKPEYSQEERNFGLDIVTHYNQELTAQHSQDHYRGNILERYLGEEYYNPDYTYTYRVPVFPFTGDAIIVGKDVNGNIKQYFTYPTVNNGYNQNVLDFSHFYGRCWHGPMATFASEPEALNSVGTISQSGNDVTVNSYAVGSTQLVGTINLPGVDKDGLNATNNTIHTSVQWTPLPNAPVPVNREYALAGQYITLKAQLTDANGNPVSVDSHPINWFWGVDDLSVPGPGNQIDGTNVAVVSMDNVTDIHGQATLVLQAGQAATVPQISAKTSRDYNLVVTVGQDTIMRVTLTWIDAKLAYLDRVTSNWTVTNKDNQIAPDVNVSVGQPWQFEYKVWDSSYANITINGVPVEFTAEPGSVGTLEKVADTTKFNATSTVSGVERVVGQFGEPTGPVTFTYSNGRVFTGVGTGKPNFTGTLTVPISWGVVGQHASFIVPGGNTIPPYGSAQLFVKVSDNFGNPIPNKRVEFSVANGGSLTDIQSTTDANGIASAVLHGNGNGSSQTSVVTAKVGDETISYIMNYAEPVTDIFGLKNASLSKSGSDDVITLEFNENVNPGSVIPGEFVVQTPTLTGERSYEVKRVAVQDNTIALTLKDTIIQAPLVKLPIRVSVQPFTAQGVTYDVVDIYGRPLADHWRSINFVSPSNSTVAATYNSGQLTVDITGYEPFVNEFGVVGNSDITHSGVTWSSWHFPVNPSEPSHNVIDDFHAAPGTIVTVYYNGASATVYIP